jgi:hypothetical protein
MSRGSIDVTPAFGTSTSCPNLRPTPTEAMINAFGLDNPYVEKIESIVSS